jgi:integrase/transcriptional regulator with XRE-family HTH domain
MIYYINISNLPRCRYFEPHRNNVLTKGYNISDPRIERSLFLEQLMQKKYPELIQAIAEHLVPDEPSVEIACKAQRVRNYLSTLNSFLAFAGKSTDDNIGAELTTRFDSLLNSYLESVPMGSRTRRDRRSQLRKMHSLGKQLLSITPIKKVEPTPLSVRLRQEIAKTGLAPKTIAREFGISTSAIQRWLKGAEPNRRGFTELRRLEHALELPRDTLTTLVTNPSPTVPPAENAYRKRLTQADRINPPLPEAQLTETFLQEWSALMRYKTSTLSSLNRSTRGIWRLLPRSSSFNYSPLAQVGERFCPTADLVLSSLRRFFGANTMGRKLITPGNISLAWLAVPEALSNFIDQLTDASEGIMHRGHSTFASTVSALLRPTTGYLWQQPQQFYERLPAPYCPNSIEAWREMCSRSYRFLREIVRRSTGTSRCPAAPIQQLLGSEEPLLPLLKVIEQLDREAKRVQPGSEEEAILKRDALLFALLISNPLRIRSVAALTWLPDGSGLLTGNADSGWRIRLDPHHLKNGGSKKRQYDVRVAGWVEQRLDEYLRLHRPTLLNGSDSNYLFLSSNHARHNRPWEGISSRIQILTRRYIDNCPGFGPHAIRHLVATAWLRKHPGEFLSVAELLHDNLTTVLENYAHLKADDTFLRHEAGIEALLAKPQ